MGGEYPTSHPNMQIRLTNGLVPVYITRYCHTSRINVMYFILGTNYNGNIRSWFCSCWIFHYGSLFPNFSQSKTQGGFEILYFAATVARILFSASEKFVLKPLRQNSIQQWIRVITSISLGTFKRRKRPGYPYDIISLLSSRIFEFK